MLTYDFVIKTLKERGLHGIITVERFYPSYEEIDSIFSIVNIKHDIVSVICYSFNKDNNLCFVSSSDFSNEEDAKKNILDRAEYGALFDHGVLTF